MSSPQKHSDHQLRLAIVGAGLVGQRHASVIQASTEAALVAIADCAESGLAFAKEQNVAAYADIAQLIQAERPDGIVLCTPTQLHVEQALQCVQAGVAVLVEKPIGTTSEESRLLVEASAEAEVPVIVGHHRRHNPLIHAAKHCIDSGQLGEIRAIHAQCWFYKPDDYFSVAPWRTQVGAGPISVNLAHDIDLIRYFCGDVLVVQAQRASSIRGHANEDVASALLTLSNGALVTVTVSDAVASPWSWELTSKEYPIYPVTDQSCYRIGGSKASLSIPDLTVWQHEQKPDWWSPIQSSVLSFEPSDPLSNQMQHFCKVIRGDEEPLVSASEGYKSLQVIEAIQQASLSGECITLDQSV